MKRKANNSPDAKNLVRMPEINKPKTAEQVSGDILTTIRQLEPEDQNEVVKTVLAELAIDRHNLVNQHRQAGDRAAKNMDTFMMHAMGIEKLLAAAMDQKR